MASGASPPSSAVTSRPAGRDVGQPEPGQHLRGPLGLGGADQDPGRAAAAQLLQRALEHQLAGAHHAHVRADLLHLGQQVRGHEHRGAVGGDLPDQARGPRGCPAGRGRWSARPGSSARAAAAGRPRWPAAASCRASRRGTACPPRRAGRPGPAPARSGPARSPGPRSGPRRPAGPGWPGRTGAGRRPGPRPATRPGTARRRSPAGMATPSSWWLPPVGWIRPSSIRIVVVLPDPFGPRKP